MKIYISNILPSSLNNKLDKFCLQFGEPESKTKHEIISKEFGLIIIEKQCISHVESSFNTNYELIKNYNNCDLLVDRTNITKNILKSQFPVNYIHTKILQLHFKIHKKAKLSLVINCLEEPDNNLELIRIPVDFYFDYDSDILDLNDPFFQEDFNMFLSALN